MSPRDLLRFAGRALLQHRRRSGASLLGVVIGVVAVLSLTAVGEGALRYVQGQFATLGSELVIVVPGKTETTGGMPHGVGGIPNDLTMDDAIAIERRVRAVRAAVPITLSADSVSFGPRSRQVPIIGVSHAFERLQRLELAMGSFLPEGDIDRGAPLVVLGDTVARELFDRRNPLGAAVRLGGWRMRVIGVLARRGTQIGMKVDESIFIPAATGLRMANLSSLSRIMLDLHPRADVDRAIERVTALLKERHGEEDFTAISQEAVLDSLASIMRILTLGVSAIAAISLMVAGIGIMNVMLVSVSERTEEVGLLKAVGATRRQILSLFLVEAALLSAAGGLVGLGAGLALVRLGVALYPAIPAAAPLWAVGAVMGLCLVTGILFGVLPAWRAAKLDPVRALQGARLEGG
ncbi:MAG: ABC transporter permease [bacterium]